MLWPTWSVAVNSLSTCPATSWIRYVKARRPAVTVPVSIEAATAAALDEQADAGVAQNNAQIFGDDERGVVFDAETGEVLEDQIASAADLNAAL